MSDSSHIPEQPGETNVDTAPEGPASGAQDSSAPSRGKRARIIAIVVVVLVALVGGLVAFTMWAMRSGEQRQEAKVAEREDARRTAWESAMRKAGVDAAYPGRQVPLTEIQASGSQPLSATFTAEEITALLQVYPYETSVAGTDVELRDVTLRFPAEGTAAIEGELAAQGSVYSAEAQAPVSYQRGEVNIDEGEADLSVEGFGVSGSRKRQALAAVSAYFSAMLEAAPGLTVESARITAEGVEVVGTAPVRLEHPGQGQ